CVCALLCSALELCPGPDRSRGEEIQHQCTRFPELKFSLNSLSLSPAVGLFITDGGVHTANAFIRHPAKISLLLILSRVKNNHIRTGTRD
ncbi:hypothetical protein PDJAM_G00054980, partial [Pangasius djambal]|nr:hypothetical protein [Pangasius djambal]